MATPNSLQPRQDADEPAPPSRWQTMWIENKGVLFVLLSEIAGASMDAIARFLQQGGTGIHSFQVMVFRMGITFLLSTLVMWWKKTPGFPLGNPAVRGWLVLRSLFGFFGLFCLYYSVRYLPLAEATVFRFLVPLVTAWACSVFLGQPFARKDLLASIVALIGVVIIAHPAAIFGHVERDEPVLDVRAAEDVDPVSSTQRLIAIVVALLGIIGASGAYTTIRIIGSRAHPLISVNYFAALTTVLSAIALSAIPGVDWVMPHGARDWVLLVALGVLGFVLQYLLTTGLTLDKSPRATSMLYAQVLFALAFDWAIWGVLPGKWSIIGGLIVIVSTLWSALQKSQRASSTAPAVKSALPDEESALLNSSTADTTSEARTDART